MLNLGSSVETVRGCGALGLRGSLDLAPGTRGTLLALNGEHAKIGLAGTNEVVYLVTSYLRQA
jgi:hypothetical protein